MRKILVAFVAVFVASFGLVTAAGAQDAHVGTIEADPATVPEAGEYTLTANGSGWLPDTSILLTSCISPADELVPGTSTEEEIGAAALAIDALADCDLATAVPIDVDADGNFTAELTAEVGPNFFFSAGALDGSQAGATWIPIVSGDAAAAEDEASDIVTTAVDSGQFPTLVAAVEAAGLVETLQGEGPFTVFAPTEEAFAAAFEALGLSAEEVLASGDILTAVLTYHVVPGAVPAADVVGLDGQAVATVQGEEVAVTVDGDTVMINSATVVTTDIMASNGVIHVIDQVLIPPSVASALGLGTGGGDAEEEAAEEEPAEEEAAEETADEPLADTGVETGLLAVIGTAVLGAGVMIAREARKAE